MSDLSWWSNLKLKTVQNLVGCSTWLSLQCVSVQYMCNFTRARWHVDIHYVLVGFFTMARISRRTAYMHTRHAHIHINDKTVCVDSLCYAWRRDPCRLERLPLMSKQVMSLKDHTCSSTLVFSLSLMHTQRHTHWLWQLKCLAFKFSSSTNVLIYLLFVCIRFYSLCIGSSMYSNNQRHRMWTKETISAHRSTCRGCLWTYYP